jgi:hypothetical protein
VVLQELEKGYAIRGHGMMDEKSMNGVEGQQVSDRQRLPESRFSERVYNQMMEKHGVVKPQGKKRSISGTNLNAQNSFAILSFDTIDLMKDMEIARHALDK